VSADLSVICASVTTRAYTRLSVFVTMYSGNEIQAGMP